MKVGDYLGGVEINQRWERKIKVVATKSDDLNSIPGSYMIEEEN